MQPCMRKGSGKQPMSRFVERRGSTVICGSLFVGATPAICLYLGPPVAQGLCVVHFCVPRIVLEAED